MRTIKFRGKTKEGEWVTGYYVGEALPNEVAILPPKNVNYDIGYIDDSECCYCIADTIGQFTGLYDNNGREIYEGDIIEGRYINVRHVIEWHEGEATFCASLIQELKYKDMCSTLKKSWIKEFQKEVVGNIHDNPELLKQQ